MDPTYRLKSDCLREFQAKSYIRTPSDFARFSAAFDRFLSEAAGRGLTLEDLEALSRGGVHFAALLELLAQEPPPLP